MSGAAPTHLHDDIVYIPPVGSALAAPETVAAAAEACAALARHHAAILAGAPRKPVAGQPWSPVRIVLGNDDVHVFALLADRPGGQTLEAVVSGRDIAGALEVMDRYLGDIAQDHKRVDVPLHEASLSPGGHAYAPEDAGVLHGRGEPGWISLRIPYRGHEISVALDDSCGAFRGCCIRSSLRVFRANQDLTDALVAEADQNQWVTLEAILRVKQAIDAALGPVAPDLGDAALLPTDAGAAS